MTIMQSTLTLSRGRRGRPQSPLWLLLGLFPLFCSPLAGGPSPLDDAVAADSWWCEFSLSLKPDPKRDSGAHLRRSLQGKMLFNGRTAIRDDRFEWIGSGELAWYVDDSMTTAIPGKEEVRQTFRGSGTVEPDPRRCRLIVDSKQGTYDLTLVAGRIKVEQTVTGGQLEQPLRMTGNPIKGGGLGASLKGLPLASLSGSRTLSDGTIVEWTLRPRAAGAIDEEEGLKPTASAADFETYPFSPGYVISSLDAGSWKGGDPGTAWFEDRWRQRSRIEEIEITIPFGERPDPRLNHQLRVFLLSASNEWVPAGTIPLAVDSYARHWQEEGSGSGEKSGGRARLRLLPPIDSGGIRFELEGPRLTGAAWSFIVRTPRDSGPVGSAWKQWRYSHIW